MGRRSYRRGNSSFPHACKDPNFDREALVAPHSMRPVPTTQRAQNAGETGHRLLRLADFDRFAGFELYQPCANVGHALLEHIAFVRMEANQIVPLLTQPVTS